MSGPPATIVSRASVSSRVPRAVVDPHNRRILAAHLACAAYEQPLTEADLALFGPRAPEVLAALAKAARRATPSMVPRLDLPDLWSLARKVALAKLAADGGPARLLPETCPFTAADLLQRDPDLDALLARLAAA